ncbi:MAG: LruC domain-containing protein [Bacteroidales bacterium]|nr:LruC domain-containing protein [Bacteroidales bacterium]
MKNSVRKYSFAAPVFILMMMVLWSSNVSAQEYLRVYTSKPKQMTSDVTGGTLVTEDFSSFNNLPNYNWAPTPNGYTSAIGTYYQTAGKSYIKNDDQYGAGTGKYMAIQVGGKVDLVFNHPVTYFGFAWPAGDGKNTIKIFRNGQVIGTFTTQDVIDLLPNNRHNRITAVNGSTYKTSDYYGKPGTGQDAGEPFAFLHFVASSGLAFDKIEFSMGAGGEFENDNHTLLNGTPQVQGTWVQLINITAPTANNDSGSGMPGNPVTINVLQNDTKGDGTIVPSTVQIDGTTSAGASLTVPNEGVWSVNTSNGAITFTPDNSLVGSPTPIKYFVRDDNNIASNLATVTITYPVGPTAVNDSTSGIPGNAVTVDVLNNDTKGDNNIDPSTVQIDGTSSPGASLTVPNEGVWSVNTATGAITFTPAVSFTGSPTPIQYTVKDDIGLKSNPATVKVTYFVGPTAVNDSITGTPGNPVTLNVLNNDTKGDADLVPSTVQIDGTSTAGASLTVTNEGVWSVNTTTGAITFTPDNSLVGSPTPVHYTVKDNNGIKSNQAQVKVTYPVIGPKAVNDTAMTEINQPVIIPVLDNDTTGSTPFNYSTLKLVSGTEPSSSTVGTFTVDNTTGKITFTPVNGFTGTATVDYSISDQGGLSSTATVVVNVLSGTENYYPATGFGTLAFEDLWPYKGDYDFNDMVIDYRFEVNTNTSNYVKSVKATFILKAFGASYENGFGFQLSSAINANDLTVTGSVLKENIVTLNSNGTEDNQAKPTVIVFDNAYDLMHSPGGIGVNTTPDLPYVTPDTIRIDIEFKPNTYTYNDLDIAGFNPFIFVNRDRSVEVHLPDYPPTSLANMSLFGTGDDNSNPATGSYYKTKNNLPWAINLYHQFDYPIEKQAIINAYLKFADWANSGGTLYQDWYLDQNGYRNKDLIYVVPNP